MQNIKFSFLICYYLLVAINLELSSYFLFLRNKKIMHNCIIIILRTYMHKLKYIYSSYDYYLKWMHKNCRFCVSIKKNSFKNLRLNFKEKIINDETLKFNLKFALITAQLKLNCNCLATCKSFTR